MAGWTDEMEEEWDEGDGDPPDGEFEDDSERSETVVCPACGADVYEDAEKCPLCGDWITPQLSGRAAPPLYRWGAVVLLAVIAALIILGIWR